MDMTATAELEHISSIPQKHSKLDMQKFLPLLPTAGPRLFLLDGAQPGRTQNNELTRSARSRSTNPPPHDFGVIDED